MAMTAWAAKFLTNSICFSVNGRTSWRYITDCSDQLAVLEQWHGDYGASARKRYRANMKAECHQRMHPLFWHRECAPPA